MLCPRSSGSVIAGCASKNVSTNPFIYTVGAVTVCKNVIGTPHLCCQHGVSGRLPLWQANLGCLIIKYGVMQWSSDIGAVALRDKESRYIFGQWTLHQQTQFQSWEWNKAFCKHGLFGGMYLGPGNSPSRNAPLNWMIQLLGKRLNMWK